MRGVALLAIAFVGLLASPYLGAQAGEGSDASDVEPEAPVSVDQSVGTVTSQLQWSSTTSGDLAIKLELRFNTPTSCGFMISSAGEIDGQPVFQYSGHDEPGRGWTVITEDTALGVHASGASIQFGTLPFDLWVGRSVHGFFASGTEEWLFAGFDLTPVDHEWTGGKSIVFDLRCDDAFVIEGIQAGRNVVGMTPHLMDSGVGATAFGATANLADSEGGHFSGSEVVFRFRAEPNFQTGLLHQAGPHGGETYVLWGDSEIFADGPPGLYDAQFVRAASDQYWRAVGLYAGLQDVQSLDAAAAL